MQAKHLAALASLLPVLSGCTHLYHQPSTWADVQKSAVVTFHDGTAKKNVIRIPVTVERLAGDSLRVLDFDANYNNGVIQVTGEMRLPDDNRPPKRELIVFTNGSHPDAMTIVYQNPNGETEVIQQVAIH